MSLFPTVSEINGDFRRKWQIFLTPVYFAAPLNGFPLELGTGVRSQKKTRMMELPGRERSLTISSTVWIQYTKVPDGRTDGHRATAKTAHIVARYKCLYLYSAACIYLFICIYICTLGQNEAAYNIFHSKSEKY